MNTIQEVIELLDQYITDFRHDIKYLSTHDGDSEVIRRKTHKLEQCVVIRGAILGE